ncbi:MAG TPA: glycosyltransferase [Acidiphilium sp.]|nr:glycosyltransferase [Acidiphilium sp.]
MITILLSTYNGAQFLSDQLASFEAQTDRNWCLFWRDDGSSDATREIMAGFAGRIGAERCREAPNSGIHLGAGQSFLSLLAAAKDARIIAFADQDDVWLPEKLARARLALSGQNSGPRLYTARQYLVDANLQSRRLSNLPARKPGFPACLTQNVVHGNTAVMNRAAADLICRIPGPAGTVHDWWSYIVVSACGGSITVDPRPVVLYRQHKGNLIGSPRTTVARAVGAIKRGPDIFMTMMRRHVRQLEAHGDLLAATARADLARIAAGLDGGFAPRLSAMRCPGLSRQTPLENLLFRLWFVLG